MAIEFGVRGSPLWPQDSVGCRQATKLERASWASPRPNLLGKSIFTSFSGQKKNSLSRIIYLDYFHCKDLERLGSEIIFNFDVSLNWSHWTNYHWKFPYLFILVIRSNIKTTPTRNKVSLLKMENYLLFFCSDPFCPRIYVMQSMLSKLNL